MHRKIAISVLTYGVVSLFKGLFLFSGLIEIVEKAVARDGANGVQALPIWFWTKKQITLMQEYIISYEHAWSFGLTEEQARGRTKRDTRYGIPLNYIYDFVLFGSVFGSLFRAKQLVAHFDNLCPQALAIDTGAPGSLAETQPEKEVSDEDLSKGKYVIDSFHILEKTDGDVAKALELVSRYLPYAKCFHLQWRKRDYSEKMLEDLFNKKGYLSDFLIIALEGNNNPVVIEIMEGDLKKIGKSMEELVELVRSYDN